MKGVGIYQPSDLSIIEGISEYILPERSACVYFLSSFNEIVYIGQTIDLMGRVAAHKHSFSFDRVHYFKASSHDAQWLITIEGAFIKKMRPPFNISGKTEIPMCDRQIKMLRKYCNGKEIVPTFGWQNEAINE